MCGIVAVLPGYSGRHLSREQVHRHLAELGGTAELGRTAELLELPGAVRPADPAGPVSAAAFHGWAARLRAGLAELNDALDGPGPASTLLRDRELLDRLDRCAATVEDAVRHAERTLAQAAERWDEMQVEAAQAALVSLRDEAWRLREDRLGWVRGIDQLSRSTAVEADAVAGYGAVETTLRGLDRLEVRGRDSAGLQVWVGAAPEDLAEFARRSGEELRRRQDPVFRNGAVRQLETGVCFVYKAAAVIGKLGDNGRRLRSAIEADLLLRRALALPEARVAVIGHTRWASVGRITEANAHPVNSVLPGPGGSWSDGIDPGPYAAAVLNGDIDNHQELREAERVGGADVVSTDAKLVPVLLARRLAGGGTPVETFTGLVRAFDGSFAVLAHSETAPDELLLAVRGSGQALYVGFARDCWVVASEPYGVVEAAASYLRVDGGESGVAAGTVLRLTRPRAGTLAGLHRIRGSGQGWPVCAAELTRAEISTRDVALGRYPHYLLKELAEAPGSMARTLRGRIVEAGGRLRPRLGLRSVPAALRAGLRGGQILRLILVGQGTAHVAAEGVRAMFADMLQPALQVQAMPATELSGWYLRPDMADTCVVAVSQSGTTTDTNRAVDLARARGAQVLAIVNRRESDLAAKADGVLYTSDGRDVEMAVASTKAFYAQIAAGVLLMLDVARELGLDDPERDDRLLRELRALPDKIAWVVGLVQDVDKVVREVAPRHRHWAVVGSGLGRVAAAEIRIKMSELCYTAIPCDTIEDKKHIDLSAESMIVVCAAGLDGPIADDAAKEVRIFQAHRNTPVVIATDGDDRYASAQVVTVPRSHRLLAWLLAVAAGHLLAYACAASIDQAAEPLRRALDSLADVPPDADLATGAAGERLRATLAAVCARAAAGDLDGCLAASTAARLHGVQQVLGGRLDLDDYRSPSGAAGTPEVFRRDVEDVLLAAADELTRSIDSVKHQAKTVTVGTSRSAEPPASALLHELVRRGVAADLLTYSAGRALAALSEAIREVTGFTRYDVDVSGPGPSIRLRQRDGLASSIPSHVETDRRLRGTKRLVVERRRVLLTRGLRDARLVLIVPEVRDGTPTGVSLLHVVLRDRLTVEAVRRVLLGYDRERWRQLVAVLTETDEQLGESWLARVGVEAALVGPVEQLAPRPPAAPEAAR